MSNVPHPVANILIGDDWEDVVTLEQMHAYAAAVTAAKDAEIAALRADFTALQRAIVGDTGASAILEAGRLRAEVAGLREFVEHVRRNGSTHLANMAVAVLAARKGDA